MMDVLFSLIIPVYNVELYIEKCLRSCLTQNDISPFEYELIVVDDGSPDGSISKGKTILREYPKHSVKFVVRKNGGLSAARNTGLENATGKYVWFIDSDDWIAECSLARLKKKIAQTNDVDILTFKHRTIFPNGAVSPETMDDDWAGTGFDYLADHSFLSAWQCIYNRNFLESNQLRFKEGMIWEDSEFNLRAYGLAKRHYFYSQHLYYYIRRADSITTQGLSFKMMDSYFVNVDSVSCFYKNKAIELWQRQVINYRLAFFIATAVAGIRSLPVNERSLIRSRLRKQQEHYFGLFWKSGSFLMMICGFLIFLTLPLAERILSIIVSKAIQRAKVK